MPWRRAWGDRMTGPSCCGSPGGRGGGGVKQNVVFKGCHREPVRGRHFRIVNELLTRYCGTGQEREPEGVPGGTQQPASHLSIEPLPVRVSPPPLPSPPLPAPRHPPASTTRVRGPASPARPASASGSSAWPASSMSTWLKRPGGSPTWYSWGRTGVGVGGQWHRRGHKSQQAVAACRCGSYACRLAVSFTLGSMAAGGTLHTTTRHAP